MRRGTVESPCKKIEPLATNSLPKRGTTGVLDTTFSFQNEIEFDKKGDSIQRNDDLRRSVISA